MKKNTIIVIAALQLVLVACVFCFIHLRTHDCGVTFETPQASDQSATFRIDSDGHWHRLNPPPETVRTNLTTAHKRLDSAVLECTTLTSWSNIQAMAHLCAQAGARRITIQMDEPSGEDTQQYLESIELKEPNKTLQATSQ